MFFLFLLSNIHMLQAASCCSTASAVPAMISGDEKALVSASVSNAEIVADAPDQGLPVFRSASHQEMARTVRIEGSHIFYDRFQAGLSFSLSQVREELKEKKSEQTTLGDTRTFIAYEWLTNWSYSPWQPKSYLFLQGTFPTGRSIYESDSNAASISTGNGFLSASLGLLFIKSFALLDFYLLPEAHDSMSRTFYRRSTAETITVDPGPGFSVSAGIGLSAGDFRIGLRVQPTWNSVKRTEINGFSTTGAVSKNISTGADLSWQATQSISASLGYTDQTLLGPASNTALSRNVSVSLSHRWQR